MLKTPAQQWKTIPIEQPVKTLIENMSWEVFDVLKQLAIVFIYGSSSTHIGGSSLNTSHFFAFWAVKPIFSDRLEKQIPWKFFWDINATGPI